MCPFYIYKDIMGHSCNGTPFSDGPFIDVGTCLQYMDSANEKFVKFVHGMIRFL